MKNYVQDGNSVDFVNGTGSAIASGEPVKVTDFVGVANGDIADTAGGTLLTSGVFILPKVSAGAIAQGKKVYLEAGGAITATVGTNTFAGYAWEAAADTETSIIVRLASVT